jgi:hypothetical protein
MQQAWDEAQARRILEEKSKREEELISRQIAREQREEEDRSRTIQLQEEEAEVKLETRRMAQDIQYRSNQHVSGFLSGLKGGIDPMGNPIPPLDPELPDYSQRRSQLIRDFPLATKSEEVSPIISAMDEIYNTRVAAEQDRSNEEEARKRAEIQGRVAIAKDLAANGLSIADYSKNGVVDFEAANTALGEKLREREQGREGEMDEREQNRALRSKKATAETELMKIRAREAAFQKRFDARNTSENRTELEAAQIERGIFEDEINRINRELGGETPAEPEAGDQTPQSFESVEEAEAARLPKGTIVVIGGRRARIH